MAIPTTKECCCGCTLRTGVLILGYLGVIGAILQLIQSAALQSHDAGGDTSADHINGQKIQPPNPVAVLFSGILSAILLYGVYKESRPAILSVVYVQLGLSVFGLIGIVVAAFIFDIPWIVPMVLVVFCTSADHINGQKIPPTNPVAVLFSGIISAILLYGVYKESRPAILSVVYVQLGLIGIVAAAFIFDILWIVPMVLVVLSIGLYFLWVEYSYTEELKERSTSPRSIA